MMSNHEQQDAELTPTSKLEYEIGTIFAGAYKLLTVLGSGGMGTVYQAEHIATGRQLALKILPRKFALAADKVQRFQSEARLLSRLNHPHIVQIFSCGVADDGVPYLAMEGLVGETLAARLRQCHKLDGQVVTGLAQQLLSGLKHAHAAGVLHRDLKPSNIMLVGADDQVKILDFGLAKLLPGTGEDDAGAATKTGIIIGSPAYMSPEQCRGGQVDERSDLYAVGCILYECLTGKTPFVDDNVLSLLCKHISDAVPPFPEKPQDKTTAILHAAIGRCLSKSPDDRFASAARMAEALTEQRVSRPWLTGGVSVGHRWRWQWIVAVFAMSVIGLSAGNFLLKQQESKSGRSPESERPQDLDPTKTISAAWLLEAEKALDRVGRTKDKRQMQIELDAALKYVNKALEGLRKRSDRTGEQVRLSEVRMLLVRARIQQIRHNYPNVLADMENAIALSALCQSRSYQQQLDVQIQLLDYLKQQHEWSRGIAVGQQLLEQANKHWQQTGEDMRPVVLRLLIVFYDASQRYDQAADLAYQQWQIQKDSLVDERREEALHTLCCAYMRTARAKEAVPFCRQWIPLAQSLGMNASLARRTLAVCLANSGGCQEGLAIMQAELDKAKKTGDRQLAYTTQSEYWPLAHTCGDDKLAVQLLREHVDTMRAEGQILGFGDAANGLAFLVASLGRSAEAERICRRNIKDMAAAIDQGPGDDPEKLNRIKAMMSVARMRLSYALQKQKRYREALDEARQSVALSTIDYYDGGRWYVGSWLALAALQAEIKDYVGARQSVEHLIKTMGRVEYNYPQLAKTVYERQAWLATATGDQAEAARSQSRASELAHEFARAPGGKAP